MSNVDQYPIRPSARWYAVVVVAGVITAGCLFYAIKPMVDVFGVNPLPIDNRASIVITDDGLTVYAATTASANAFCTVTDANGNVLPLNRVEDTGTFDLRSTNGVRMFPLATTPDDLAAGTYRLHCVGVGANPLGFSDRINIDRVIFQIGALILLSGLFGTAGLVVLIVLLVKRHNSKNRLRWAQAAYAGWGQWYASPYGYQSGSTYPGYWQQGDPQSGYPGQDYPQSGYPGQDYPQSGYPGQDYPQSGYPGQGYPPSGYPGQGYPQSGAPTSPWPPSEQPGDSAGSPPASEDQSERPPDDRG